jgi:hypothetical protein
VETEKLKVPEFDRKILIAAVAGVFVGFGVASTIAALQTLGRAEPVMPQIIRASAPPCPECAQRRAAEELARSMAEGPAGWTDGTETT